MRRSHIVPQCLQNIYSLSITEREKMIQTKTTSMVLLIAIASVGTTGMIAGFNMLSLAFAQSSTSSTANDFGQSASLLAKGELPALPGVQMGQHASSVTANPTTGQTEPRVGLGNVGQQVLGCHQKVKPGQLADILTGQASC